MSITTTTRTEEQPDWLEAGEAWSHAALDWAMKFEPHSRDAIEHVFRHMNVGQETSVVDLACGSGYALGIAERLGASTAGIDASAGLIEIAQRRAPASDLIVGSMFDLPWGDHSFDVATSFNGIWGGCQQAIDEAYRVLRPGGSLALTFWGPGRALDLRDFFIVVGTTAPGAAEELKGLAAIGAPGVCETMLQNAGFEVGERGSTSGIIEAVDADDVWRTLRSPGVVVPSLGNVGESELRRQAIESVRHCRNADGSYRIINEVTHVVAHKPTAG